MYILMKFLESSPSRYDRWISVISFGSLGKIYDYMVSYIEAGMKVLDIGCGTGLLTLRVAKRGAYVKGIDPNPAMLEIAERKLKDLWNGEAKVKQLKDVRFVEMGVAELGKEKENSYDAVISGLCFSELSDDEIDFTLEEVKRILKRNGWFIVADEVLPSNRIKRFLYRLLRVFLLIPTFLFTGMITKPLKKLPQRLKDVGFKIEQEMYNGAGNFVAVIAKKEV